MVKVEKAFLLAGIKDITIVRGYKKEAFDELLESNSGDRPHYQRFSRKV